MPNNQHRTVRIKDFLTDEDISRLETESITEAKEICEKIIRPQIDKINRKLGQENDPMFLAYMVEYAISVSRRST